MHVFPPQMNQKRDARNLLYQLRDYLRERCSKYELHIDILPPKDRDTRYLLRTGRKAISGQNL